MFENSYEIIEKDVLNLNTDINFNNISVVYIDPPYFNTILKKYF